jgi:hypothetical protein
VSRGRESGEAGEEVPVRKQQPGHALMPRGSTQGLRHAQGDDMTGRHGEPGSSGRDGSERRCSTTAASVEAAGRCGPSSRGRRNELFRHSLAPEHGEARAGMVSLWCASWLIFGRGMRRWRQHARPRSARGSSDVLHWHLEVVVGIRGEDAQRLSPARVHRDFRLLRAKPNVPAPRRNPPDQDPVGHPAAPTPDPHHATTSTPSPPRPARNKTEEDDDHQPLTRRTGQRSSSVLVRE